MARARNIKPSFFTNDVLGECPVLARLLFAGLWTIADREGRLEDRPKKIKAEILPYDDCNISDLLNTLQNSGFIVRYKGTDNNSYIQILNFTKHQNPHQKETASTIPAPDLSGASTVQNRNKPGLNPYPSSPIPHPDSPIPLTPVADKAETAEEFENFWIAYPKQRIGNRKKAAAAFREALKRATVNQILDGVSRYAISDEVAKGFAKGAAAWLNDDRWNNDYTKGNTNAPRTGNHKSAVDAMFAGFVAAVDNNTV